MKCFREILTVAVLAIPAPGFCTEVSLSLKQGQVLSFVTTATKQGVVGIALSNKCRDSFKKLNRCPVGAQANTAFAATNTFGPMPPPGSLPLPQHAHSQAIAVKTVTSLL